MTLVNLWIKIIKPYTAVIGVTPRRSRRSQNSSQRSVTDMFAAISKRKSVETEVQEQVGDDEQETKRPRIKVEVEDDEGQEERQR